MHVSNNGAYTKPQHVEQEPKHSPVYHLLRLPVTRHETVLDKLFQAFFRFLSVVATMLQVVGKRKG